MKIRASSSYIAAINKAKRYAAEGPRVAAVVIARKPKLKYLAFPGFMDSNTDGLEQVLLVTPDGRTWKPEESR